MNGNVVIVGGGQAGAQTALSLRQQGFTGKITIIGQEPVLPYERPPLSKGFLAGSVTSLIQLYCVTSAQPLAFIPEAR